MPQGPSLLHQSALPSKASQHAAGVREEATDRGGQQLEASAAGEARAHPGRVGDTRPESKAEEEQERGDAHGAGTLLGRKLKRGKKRKPASQLQRVQAEVQAKKASPVAADCTADDPQPAALHNWPHQPHCIPDSVASTCACAVPACAATGRKLLRSQFASQQSMCQRRRQSRGSGRNEGGALKSMLARWLRRNSGASSTLRCCASGHSRGSLSCATAWTRFLASCKPRPPKADKRIGQMQAGASQIFWQSMTYCKRCMAMSHSPAAIRLNTAFPFRPFQKAFPPLRR